MPDDDFEPGEDAPESELDQVPADVPEADAIEQHQPLESDVDDAVDSIPFDAPEADVLEQARTVAVDEYDDGD
jgi:hypothetical protein